MTLLRQASKRIAGLLLCGAAMLAMLGAMPPPVSAPSAQPEPVPAEVRFMRAFIARVNPSLTVEDPACVQHLPGAILRYATTHDADWQRLLTLAWQESDFDCHAKNRADPGGAYGPFQIRRLWAPVIGDPRPRYYDPELAVERVVQVIAYYRQTERYQTLVERRFRNPLLCLYNTGETLRRINMAYCRGVGRKLNVVRAEWAQFEARESRRAAPQQAAREVRRPTAG